MIKNKCKKIVSAMLLMTMIATTFSVDVFAGGDSSCVKVKDTIKDCCGEKEGQNLISVGDISAVKVENNIKCDITFNGCCGCCCKKDDDNNKNCKPESETENKGTTDDKPIFYQPGPSTPSSIVVNGSGNSVINGSGNNIIINQMLAPVSTKESTDEKEGHLIIGKEIENKKITDVVSIPKDKIKSVEIRDGVTSIGESAFADCKGLTSITIPDSVTSIGREAFANCTNLKTVSLPNRSVKIGDYAFAGCEAVFEYRDECKERK